MVARDKMEVRARTFCLWAASSGEELHSWVYFHTYRKYKQTFVLFILLHFAACRASFAGPDAEIVFVLSSSGATRAGFVTPTSSYCLTISNHLMSCWEAPPPSGTSRRINQTSGCCSGQKMWDFVLFGCVNVSVCVCAALTSSFSTTSKIKLVWKAERPLRVSVFISPKTKLIFFSACALWIRRSRRTCLQHKGKRKEYLSLHCI